MKNKYYLYFILSLLNNSSFAQVADTLSTKQTYYFDKDYNMVEGRSNAIYYLVLNKLNGKIVNPSTEYYMSGTIHWTGNVVTCEQNNYVTDGVCTWYDENGKKQFQVPISTNHYNGKYYAWYPNGNLKEEADYVNDSIDGCDKIFDENGNCISSAILVKNSPTYAKLPDEPRYKIDCKCPNDIKSAANSSVFAINNYSNDQVGFYINDLLATNESVLLKVNVENQEKDMIVYFSYNKQEVSSEYQEVADALLAGIIGCDIFERIPFGKYKDYYNDKISYVISYSDINVNIKEVPKPDGAICYSGYESCILNIKGIDGKMVDFEKIIGKTYSDMIGIGYTPSRPDVARKVCTNYITKHVNKHFTKGFDFKSTETAIVKQDQNGNSINTDSAYLGTGLVGDRLNDFLNTPTAILFNLTNESKYSNPFVTFKIGNTDQDKRTIEWKVEQCLEFSKCLKKIPFKNYKNHLPDTIFYSIGCSDIQIKSYNSSTIVSGMEITCQASFNLWIRNISGELLLDKYFVGFGFGVSNDDALMKVDFVRRVAKYLNNDFEFK